MHRWGLWGLVLLATLPATTNYQLNSYGFGSGGTAGSSTATYSIEGISGESSGASGTTTNYQSNPGYIQTQQANVPLITLDNESGQDYNKLHFVIDTQNNPSDATYLVALSTDSSFTTGRMYLQTDGTLSSTLSLSEYQSSSALASLSHIIGLLPNTTYYGGVLATQGKYTESAFGPEGNPDPAFATTAQPSLTFNLQTSNQASPPFTISLGTLTTGNINTSAQTINTSLSTNGASGGDVYVTAVNGGLLSNSTGYLISSVSNDLGSLSEGFGAQNSSITQTSGGPFTVISPYNGSSNIVGIINGTTRSLYDSLSPITSGSGTLTLKAKAASTDIAATDYQEILTFTAAGNF